MITLIHPSRGRAEQAYKTWSNWTEKADNLANIEYLFSWDSDACEEYYRKFFYADSLISICLRPNKSAIEAINNAAKIATGDILIVVSDDTDCPEHWDTLLQTHIFCSLTDYDFVAKVDDGLQPTLVTMPIIGRTYYERYGYIYHPEFLHMHCDEELTCVALMTGKYIKIPLLFRHLHYSAGLSQKDEINTKNDNTWIQGQATLDRHALNNFGIENPVMRREDIKWR